MIPFRYNARSLLVRKATTFATAFGIALVVFVMGSSLMLSAGVKKALSVSARPDQCIILRKGSDAELNSILDEPNVKLILAAPGVAADEKGGPVGAGEIVVVIAKEHAGTTGITNVMVRGLPEGGWKLRESAKVVAGRMAKPGTDEVVVGQRLRGRFQGFDLEQSFELKKGRSVKVVGILEDGGSSYESEVLADLQTVREAFGRDGIVSSVRVRLSSRDKFDAFKATVESDKNLGFLAQRESEYFEKQSEGVAIFVTALGTLIAVFFSIGAMIGAMITMYASIANRQREIGTLRALGFSRSGILFAFLLEAVLLSLGGGLLGALATLPMKLVSFSMLNFATWSEITFSFEPTPQILISSFVFAAVMGIAGGFFPALRAARVSPIVAMRG